LTNVNASIGRFQRVIGATRGAGQAVGQELQRFGEFARFEADWLVLVLGDTPLPPTVQAILSRVHQRFEPVPHLPPLMMCPVVVPAGQPRPVLAGRMNELLMGPAIALDAVRPATAIALSLPTATEGQLDLTAAAPGTDWGVTGRESAVVSLFIDGEHNQDVVLYGGATPTHYALSLGPLAAGRHTITWAYSAKGSTSGATSVTLHSACLKPAASGEAGLAEKYQPYFYGRGTLENNHTDVPLSMWCETTRQGDDTVLAYSVMHSNEDGGTAADPAAEQASWGRETDPDPIATVTVGPDGRIKDVHYIGWLDEPARFNGHFEGSHPVLRVARDNNSYDDRGTTPLLFRPRVALRDFTGGSREVLMEESPWMYRLSQDELRREGKELTPLEAAEVLADEGKPGFKRPSKVMDLRQYLYVDFNAANPRHSQIAVAVKLKGQAKWFRSDLGDPSVDVLWSGNGLRTSVPLPAGIRPEDVETIRVLDTGGSDLAFNGVNRAYLLDENYAPQYLDLPKTQAPRTLASRHALEIAVGEVPTNRKTASAGFGPIGRSTLRNAVSGS
jgi:hypothetical protein